MNFTAAESGKTDAAVSLQHELRTLDGLLIKTLRRLVAEYGLAGVRDTLNLIAKDNQP